MLFQGNLQVNRLLAKPQETVLWTLEILVPIRKSGEQWESIVGIPNRLFNRLGLIFVEVPDKIFGTFRVAIFR
jgi:hypothetical protein